MINSQRGKLIGVGVLLAILGAILLKDHAGLVPIATFVSGREPGDGEASADEETEPGVATNAAPRYLTELKNWRQLFSLQDHRRDPFRSTIEPSTKTVPSNDGRTVSLGLQLQAISRNAHRALVVINGQILGVGDAIQGYKLAHIDRDWVLLKPNEGPERKLQLDFHKNPGEGSEPEVRGQPGPSEDPADSPSPR